MKKLNYRLAGTVVIAVSAAYAVGLIATKHVIVSARQSRVLPAFRLDVEVFNYETDESGTLVARKTVVRDSSGTTATIMSSGPNLNKTVKMVTLPDQTRVNVNDHLLLKTTTPSSSSHREALIASESQSATDCTVGATRKIKDEVIMGQVTNVVEILKSEDRIISWKAPSLGCAVLQYRWDIRKSKEQGFTAKAEGKLTRLTMGDPDPALLDTGAKYTELPPSVFEARSLVGIGLTEDVLTPVQQGNLAKLDAAYYKARKIEGNPTSNPRP